MYIPIHIHMFSLYIGTCMYDFRANHMKLDNQLTCSFLGKTSPPVFMSTRKMN